ncbi:MAG: PDZ domain-containing protein, partial [Planctomycetes bacterium]|nr:PDZ domain-containing protein [Planctomycetota bacterium]
AKTSPVNYGGALVDIDGQVLGVITPLSASGNEEMSGVEWYDGGIGFAIPLVDVYETLDRMKSGTDLLPGLLGVSYVGAPSTNVPVVIDRVRFNSPAQRSGIQAKDRIVEANGVKIERVAQLKQLMGRMYAEESLKLKLLRNEQTIAVDAILAGELLPYEPSFLGILPRRGTLNEAGTIVRFVFPDSPAAKAGLVVGDRIIQFEKQPVSDSRSLNNAVSRLRPGDTVSIAYIRDGNESTVQIKLAAQPNTIVSELSADLQRSSSNLTNPQTETTNKPESKNDSKEDVDGSKKSEQESDQSKTEEELKRGRWTGELAQFEHSYWAYVPEDYEPSQSFGLMVWIHPNGDVMEAAIQKQWKSICDRRRMIIIGPKADDVKRWVPGEAQFVKGLVNHIRERYSIDPSRIFLHTQGNGS